MPSVEDIEYRAVPDENARTNRPKRSETREKGKRLLKAA